MSDSSTSTPTTAPQNLFDLPGELVSRVFDFYADIKLTPLRLYPLWERDSVHEDYLRRVPQRLRLPESQPRWMNEGADELDGTREPLRRAHDHALLYALPKLSHEYLYQMFRNTLIVVDLDVATLQDPAEWFEAAVREPLPVFGARNLYVRLLSTRQLRSRDPTTKADLEHLVAFLKRFHSLEFLSVDGVSSDTTCQLRGQGFCVSCTDCTDTPTLPLQDMLPKSHFKSLCRVIVARQNWVWDEKAGKFADKGKLAVYGTRWEWREVQRKAAKLGEVKWLMMQNRQARWAREKQSESGGN